MSKLLTLLSLVCLLFSCSDSGVGRTDQKIVPNHTPEPNLEIVPVEDRASTAEILQLEKAMRATNDSVKVQSEQVQSEQVPSKPEPDGVENIDRLKVEALNEPAEMETARAFRRKVLGEPALRSFPSPEETVRNRRTTARDMLAPGKRRNAPKKPTKKAEKERPRQGGNQLFEARSVATGLGSLIPPGQFFRARLLGNVYVTAFETPVFAEILGQKGESLGIAVGSASLHPNQKNRALFRFSEVHLNDGASISGSLEGFEQDLSLGIRGRAERKGLMAVVNAVAETFLAALSLEVDTGSEFGSVFKFQLADRLMQQAQDRLNEMDLQRMVTLQRDTAFWVAGTQTTNVREQPNRFKVGSLTQSAFDATMNGSNLDGPRKQALATAYDRLSQRMNALQR